ncbi:MAG: sporulation protein YunB [Acutalibacteraceae bacterium]|nr:sporulation protein YunB [Acutalibacteraceae bacterium]
MKRRRRCENAFLIKTAAVLLAVAVLLSVVFYKMRPVILRHAESAAETLLLDASNKAILDILSEQNVSYNDIVTLSREESGRVTSLETDIVKINSLKSLISNRLSGIISENEYYDLYIPLGTFFSSTYTSGYGPKIHFKMQLTATARVNFSHEFKAAGINQVLHIVMVDMDISGSLVITGYNGGISVKNQAMAAQTIIVGTTPEAFTNVIESEQDNTAGLINDYGAVH